MFLNSNLISFSPIPPKSTAKTCLEIPTMSEIMAVSKSQGLRIQLRTFGPFFKINAAGEKGDVEVGRAEGVIRPWFGGEKILHLDSMRMSRATLDMDRSLFGLGLFLGAVAVRYGFDLGCKRAQLLAINDSPLYHSKVSIPFSVIRPRFLLGPTLIT